MLVSAPTAHDMREWITAFRNHQIEVMKARAALFEKKLERSGVKVPRASILMTSGPNAPLQAVKAMRTQSAVNATIQPLSAAVGAKALNSHLERSVTTAIKEEEKEDEFDGASAAAAASTIAAGSMVATSQVVPPKQGILDEVTWHYFEGNGRADPIRQMFEYHGQPYTKVDREFGEWEQAKANGEGDGFGGGLPQAFITVNGEEHRMAQFGAILRSFGVRFGYYNPSDWQMSLLVDPIVETWGDVLGVLAGILFAPDDQKPAAIEKYLGVAKKLHQLAEKCLAHSQGKFIAGSKVTIADFIFASYIGNYIENENAPVSAPAKATLDETPLFKSYCDVVLNEFPYLKTRPAPGPL